MPTSSPDIVSIFQFFVGLSLLGGHSYLQPWKAAEEIVKALGGAWITEPLARELATLGPDSQARVHTAVVEAFARALDALAAEWKQQEGPRADVSCFQKLKQWTPDQVRLEPLKQGLELHVALSNTLLSMVEGEDPKLRQFLQARLAQAVEPHFYNALAQEPQAWARIQLEVFQKLSSGLEQIHDQQQTGTDELVHRLKALENRLNRRLDALNTSPITGKQLETWMKQTQAALQALGASGEKWDNALRHLDGALKSIDDKLNTLAKTTTTGFQIVQSQSQEQHAEVLGKLGEVLHKVTPPPPAFTLLHVSTPRWPANITPDQRQASMDAALEQARQLAKSLGSVDLLVLSGTPGMGEDGTFKETRTWLDKLHKCLHLDASKVLIVPGPNDVERGWLSKNPAAFSMHPLLRSMPELFEQFLQAQSSAQFETTLWPKLKAYSTFAQACPLSHLTPTQPWVDVSISPKPEFGMVELRGLNTCLLAFDDDPPGCLALGQRQLDAVNPLAPDLLALIVLGHPLEHLRDGKPLRERVDLGPALLLEPTHRTGIVFRALQLKQGQLRHFEPNAGWQEVRTPLEGLHVGGPLVQWLRSRKHLTPEQVTTAVSSRVTSAAHWAGYMDYLLEQHSSIELKGIHRLEGALSLPLENVYVELRAIREGSTRAQGGGHGKEAHAHILGNPEVSDRSHHLHEALARSPRAIFVGDPGSGKTTLLRYVARVVAEGVKTAGEPAHRARKLLQLDDRTPIPFPLFTTLAELDRYFAERETPLHKVTGKLVQGFLCSVLEQGSLTLSLSALKEVIDAGQLLVLLDGFDEIPGHQARQRAAKAVKELLACCPRLRVLMTSRTRAFDLDTQTVLSSLERWQLQPMSHEELKRFLDVWFVAVHHPNEAKGHTVAEELFTEIQQHPDVKAMATTPNIVTLIAILKNSHTRLPKRRVELYSVVIDLFLVLKDEARGLEDLWREELGLSLQLSEKRQLLATLALEMHSGVAEGEEKGEAARTVPTKVPVMCFARQLLEAGLVPNEKSALSKAAHLLDVLELRSGLLRKEGYGVQFRHLGLQEYLAALALSWETNDSTLWKRLEPHLKDDWWNEVFRLLVALREKQSGPLLLNLANAGQGAKPDWQQAGRGIALALGGLNDLPPLHVTKGVESAVMGKLDLLVGKKTRVPIKDRVEALLALGRVGDPRLGLEKPENWIWIPPGEFRMGSNDDDDEKPIHLVKLSHGFHMSRFPVTNHDFKAFVEDGGYSTQDWWSEEGWAFCQKEKLEAPGYWTDPKWNAPNQPVVMVSWYEADAFCRWMSTQRSRLPLGTAVVRLPTEAEWEYAARGTPGRAYPWGNDAPTPERANFDETELHQTSPVGAYPLGATPEGLLDLAGNVWEWVEDWDGLYSKDAQNDPSGPKTGSYRVLRGGSWNDSARDLRGTYRLGNDPSDRDNDVGFRVVAPGARGGSR